MCRAVANFDFSPGLLTDLLPLLEKKRQSHTSVAQDDCILLFDELEIEKQLEYERGTGKSYTKTRGKSTQITINQD